MRKIVIAMTTCYKSMNEVRAQLALEVVAEARGCGHTVVIVDDSPASVAAALVLTGATVLTQIPGTTMGASRRQAISRATELAGKDGWIAWMEEKPGFSSTLTEMVASRQEADLIIPRRRGMGSYPWHQRQAESLGNYAFRLLSGMELDLWFGPRVFKASAAHFFLDYQGEHGDRWESMFIPVVRAVKAGAFVQSHDVDFWYPPAQCHEEEDNYGMLKKRTLQLYTLVHALEKEWNKVS